MTGKRRRRELKGTVSHYCPEQSTLDVSDIPVAKTMS